jgi:hypothetical protein
MKRTLAFYRDELDHPSDFEPALPAALAQLSSRQRAAVLLVHGYGMSLRETATLLGGRVEASVVQPTGEAVFLSGEGLDPSLPANVVERLLMDVRHVPVATLPG